MKLFISLFVFFGLLGKPALVQQPYAILETDDPIVEEAPEEIETKTIQEITTEIAEKYLGEYLEKQLIADIVTVAFAVLGYAGLFVTYVKYRKNKKETTEKVSETIEKELRENLIKSFVKLSDDTIKPLLEQNKELKEGYETIMKVLVLMQDSTPKGKVAIIDYLGHKTKNNEIKEQSEKIVEEIEKNETIKEEVNSKVSGEYEEIF